VSYTSGAELKGLPNFLLRAPRRMQRIAPREWNDPLIGLRRPASI
jgi:hypothetical protein